MKPGGSLSDYCVLEIKRDSGTSRYYGYVPDAFLSPATLHFDIALWNALLKRRWITIDRRTTS